MLCFQRCSSAYLLVQYPLTSTELLFTGTINPRDGCVGKKIPAVCETASPFTESRKHVVMLQSFSKRLHTFIIVLTARFNEETKTMYVGKTNQFSE